MPIDCFNILIFRIVLWTDTPLLGHQISAQTNSQPLPSVWNSQPHQFCLAVGFGWIWIHIEMCFCLKVKEIKNEIHKFFDWMWILIFYFHALCQCLDIVLCTAYKIILPQQNAVQLPKTLLQRNYCGWLTPLSVFTLLVWVLWLQLNFLTPK